MIKPEILGCFRARHCRCSDCFIWFISVRWIFAQNFAWLSEHFRNGPSVDGRNSSFSAARRRSRMDLLSTKDLRFALVPPKTVFGGLFFNKLGRLRATIRIFFQTAW